MSWRPKHSDLGCFESQRFYGDLSKVWRRGICFLPTVRILGPFVLHPIALGHCCELTSPKFLFFEDSDPFACARGRFFVKVSMRIATTNAVVTRILEFIALAFCVGQVNFRVVRIATRSSFKF